MSLSTRIKEARKAARLTQRELASRAGLRQPTLSDLEQGKTLGTGSIAAIASVLGVNALWLAEGRGPRLPGGDMPAGVPPKGNEQLRRVPLISWVQAGAWAAVVDSKTLQDMDEWVPVPEKGGPRCFALRVRGESMRNPDGEPSFSENDKIIVDPDREPMHRSLIVVQLADKAEATFKQLIIEGSDKFLKALNPSWPEPFLRINGNAAICGVVIGKHVDYV